MLSNFLIQQNNKMYKGPPTKKLNKRFNQIISKFKYYLQIISHKDKKPTKTSLFSRKNPMKNFQHHEEFLGPSHYHYIKSVRQKISHYDLINQEILQKLADQHLINNGILERQLFKINLNLKDLIRKTEAIVLSFNAQKQKNQENPEKKRSFIDNLQSESDSARENASQNEFFELYLVSIIEDSHHEMNLLYLVQRITIRKSKDNSLESQQQNNLTYESIIGFRQQNPMMQVISDLIFTSKSKNILQSIKQTLQEKLNTFQSSLFKQLQLVSIKHQKEGKLSHPEFKREDKLPIAEYKKYEKLRIQIYKYFKEINPMRELNKYFLDNLICRFFKLKQYQYSETLKSIKFYLDWQKSMRDKYTYQSFEIFHKMNLYKYLGKDKDGRPVLFFRTYNVYPGQIPDINFYYDYTFWMLDLFIQDKTEGYIDDFILIGNYEPFSSDNFKFHIAKEIASRANDLFPDRQFKLVCFGLGTFTNFIFNLLTPVLPAFILQKVVILGCDRKEVKQYLQTLLDPSILPQEVLLDGHNQIRPKNT